MSSSASPTHREGLSARDRPGGPDSPRILLVDDDPVNQMVAVGLLRRQGWQVTAAANGKEALQLLARQTFDLILMDLQMPEMDGYQTATLIRQHEARPSHPADPRATAEALSRVAGPQGGRIPIIALTTASQPGVREKCLAVGMDDFLNKPVNPRELYATVQKHLEGSL
jgi:CheY-like chemotaxis protein